MSKSSRYKGVQSAGFGNRWIATMVLDGKPLRRGPFPLQGQAVEARRLMVEAKEAGREIPTTTQLKEQVGNVALGDEKYEPTMRERRRAAANG